MWATTDCWLDAFKRPGSYKSTAIQEGLLVTIPVSILFAPHIQVPNSHAARLESAGYYFGYKRQSRTWDMENRLYDHRRFKPMMVFALVVTFTCLTGLGIIL